VFLHTTLQTRLGSTAWRNSFISEWTVLILPLLLCQTLYAESPSKLSLYLFLPSLLLLLLLPRKHNNTQPLPTKTPPSNEAAVPVGPKLAGLSIYRAHMMLMTIIAILAVDFPSVFPRSLAKCESFGVSMVLTTPRNLRTRITHLFPQMDLGVGSFIFSQGIISARSLSASANAPTLLPTKLYKVTRKSLPVIALGLVRVVLVKGTEYPVCIPSYFILCVLLMI